MRACRSAAGADVQGRSDCIADLASRRCRRCGHAGHSKARRDGPHIPNLRLRRGCKSVGKFCCPIVWLRGLVAFIPRRPIASARSQITQIHIPLTIRNAFSRWRFLFRWRLSCGKMTEINMRRIIYTSIVAITIGAGSVSGSYAAGRGSTSTSPSRGLTTGSPTSTTGMSTGTNTGMGNSAGSAAAGANSVSNPSGNQLMPGSPTMIGGRPAGGRR